MGNLDRYFLAALIVYFLLKKLWVEWKTIRLIYDEKLHALQDGLNRLFLHSWWSYYYLEISEWENFILN